MNIREIAVDNETDFAAWFGVCDAADRVDVPDLPRWTAREQRVLRASTEYNAISLWLAERGGIAIGAASLKLPLTDNPNFAMIDLAVLPDARRRGCGTGLLRTIEKAAADAGRSSLFAFLCGPLGTDSTPGTAFAERYGFSNRLSDTMRAQRAPYDLDSLAGLERDAQPHAEEYELLSWRRRVPDEHAAEFARLVARMSTDAPMGDLDYEPEVWDVGRVQLTERRVAEMGRDLWYTVAVAPDGTLAGMTELMLATDSDEYAFQGDTIVDPAHRGHRLGLLIKAANLRALLADRPGVEAVYTWNAESNEHMVSVNEQLGYVKHSWGAEYQRG